LEKEVLHLKAKAGEPVKSSVRILPREVWKVEEEEEAEELAQLDWWSRITSYFTFGQNPEQKPAEEPKPVVQSNPSSPSNSSVPVRSDLPPVKLVAHETPSAKNH
jgi:hypothetical protein